MFDPLEIAIFGQNSKFLAKNGHFRTPKTNFLVVRKKNFGLIIFWSHPERHFKLSYAPIAQCIWSGSAKIQILGQKHHVWPKIAIFSGPKSFKSGSAVRPHRDLSNEVSYAPLATCTWSGSTNK